MREIVERVLGAEDEAKSKIEAARKRASAVKADADEAAAAFVAKAREKAVADTRARLDQARASAERLIVAAREAADAEAERNAGTVASERESLVAEIVGVIAGRP